MGEEPT